MAKTYFLYIWTIRNNVEVAEARDATLATCDESALAYFRSNLEAAEKAGFNYRIICDSKLVKEHIAA